MRDDQAVCWSNIHDQWTTSNPTIIPYWPWKTKNHFGFSLVAGTKSSHQLEDRRIPLADTCSRLEENPSFNRTTMEKGRRRKGIKGNERLATSLETTKKRDEPEDERNDVHFYYHWKMSRRTPKKEGESNEYPK